MRVLKLKYFRTIKFTACFFVVYLKTDSYKFWFKGLHILGNPHFEQSFKKFYTFNSIQHIASYIEFLDLEPSYLTGTPLPLDALVELYRFFLLFITFLPLLGKRDSHWRESILRNWSSKRKCMKPGEKVVSNFFSSALIIYWYYLWILRAIWSSFRSCVPYWKVGRAVLWWSEAELVQNSWVRGWNEGGVFRFICALFFAKRLFWSYTHNML